MTGDGVVTTGGEPSRGGRRGRQRFATPAMRDALAPVTEAMLRRARDQAGDIVAQARQEAEAATESARRAADALASRARQEGRSQAAPMAAARLGRGRRDARSVLLAARREAHEELRARVRAEVSALRTQPGYDLLLERLRRLAAGMAGPGATVTEDPAGGAVARTPGVVVDCSLPRLADAAVDALGAQIERLWTPGAPGGRETGNDGG